MSFLKDRTPLIVLVVGSVAVIGILVDLLGGQSLVKLMANMDTDRTREKLGKIEAMYAFDVSDKRRLVGAASNVFVGRVVGKTGEKGRPGFDPEGPSEPVPGSPRTQFEVAVTKNIKGNLKGPITVSQEGGHVEYAANRDYPEAGLRKGERVRELMLFEGDALLRPGQEVLLVTSYEEQNGWYRVEGQPFGTVRLSSVDQGERQRTLDQFEEAVRDQIKDPVLERDPIPSSERPYPEGPVDDPTAPPGTSSVQ